MRRYDVLSVSLVFGETSVFSAVLGFIVPPFLMAIYSEGLWYFKRFLREHLLPPTTCLSLWLACLFSLSALVLSQQ